jgi:ArsR family transcriptional regulator
MEPPVLAAFSNSVRLQILSTLTKRRGVSELIEICHISQSALSQHLQKLRKAKLVKTSKEGKQVYYSVINTKTVRIANKLLELVAQGKNKQ